MSVQGCPVVWASVSAENVADRPARASELLLSIPQHKRTQEKTRINATSSTAYQADTAPYSPVAGPSQPPVSLSAALSASLKQVPSQVMLQDAELQCTEDDEITMARDWIDTRDFTRVSTLLKNCKSTKARFLSAYSRYLVRSPPFLGCLFFNTYLDNQTGPR